MKITVKKGHDVDIFNLKVEDIHISDIIRTLPNICRYGGRLNKFFSVAQHAVILARYMCHINRYDLVPLALLHDACETYIGDMSYPIKIKFPVFLELEEEITQLIYTKYGVDYSLSSDFNVYDKNIAFNEARDLGLINEEGDHPFKCWTPLAGLPKIEPWSPELARDAYKYEIISYFGTY